MSTTTCMFPNLNEGRFFVSPILGCFGACSYCYLEIRNFHIPRKNELTTSDFLSIAQQSEDFCWGQNGTIISVGAWGDIFPPYNDELILHSVQFIKDLLSWGNPVQIMSKNAIDNSLIDDICNNIRFPNQLLYSTTITTLNKWKKTEPGTSSPNARLNTCRLFKHAGIPTNVLIKPFIPNLAGKEIETIANLLLEYQIDFCTVGIMYWSDEIEKKVSTNPSLKNIINPNAFSSINHLDCNGKLTLSSTSVHELLKYVHYLRKRGIAAFLKSSCVNSNILHIINPSHYYINNNNYCIKCGNCNKQQD